ncbi:hypothetical protein SISNIDRAFT_496371 [Sistotremastrum niveocremeum HHB9708]|uniref:Uncharacterized protein n=1 Tax=Sistotremastrum niveocremeum HHB9708 TaxID=1314777 RepID=A0A164T534_9AGAM|nr:hypothetical protein SISNIDRAFT_496371 [Sistotremastrum niveocremeum HHB9708]
MYGKGRSYEVTALAKQFQAFASKTKSSHGRVLLNVEFCEGSDEQRVTTEDCSNHYHDFTEKSGNLKVKSAGSSEDILSEYERDCQFMIQAFGLGLAQISREIINGDHRIQVISESGEETELRTQASPSLALRRISFGPIWIV